MTLGRDEALQNARRNQFPGFTIQEAILHTGIHSQIDGAQHGTVHDGLPEFLHEIEHQRRLARTIHVQKSGEGFQPGERIYWTINLADGLRRRLLRKEDRPMDGERMERDPMEEGQGVHSPGAGGWQEHNDMQAR